MTHIVGIAARFGFDVPQAAYVIAEVISRSWSGNTDLALMACDVHLLCCELRTP